VEGLFFGRNTMGTGKSPEELKQFWKVMSGRVDVTRTSTENGVEKNVNLLGLARIKYMGQLVEKNPLHIKVLVGEEGFAGLLEEMERRGVSFGMDTLGWEAPIRP
jgi:hypothetical protein